MSMLRKIQASERLGSQSTVTEPVSGQIQAPVRLAAKFRPAGEGRGRRGGSAGETS